MFLYADPEACPACRTTIAAGSTRCANCETTLTGPFAIQLFDALTRADRLVTLLASESARSAAESTATAATPTASSLAGAPLDAAAPYATPYPASPRAQARPRRGLSAATVPQILLGLGACCLLVAALVFLAVAWSALGVGGRTAVLVGLTAAAAGGAWLLARARLRAGAESFMVLALGLLTLNVVGARTSGWFGDIADSWFTFVLGGSVAAAALLGTHLLRSTPVGRLVGSQLIAGLAAAIGTAGLAFALVGDVGEDIDLTALASLLWFALLAATTWLTHRQGFPMASIITGSTLGFVWLWLVLLGLVRLEQPLTLAAVWGDLRVWPTLVGALIAGTAALPLPAARRLPTPVRMVGAATATALVTALVTLPAFDEEPTTITIVASLVVILALGATLALPMAWRGAIVVPAFGAGLALIAGAALPSAYALDALLGAQLWSQSATSSLDHTGLAWHEALMLPISVAGLLVTLLTFARLISDVPPTRYATTGGLVVIASATLLPPLFGVPLVVAVVVLLLTGAVLGVAALRLRSTEASVVGTVAALTAGGGVLASCQSIGLTALSSGLITAAAVAVTMARNPVLRTLGDLAFAPAVATFLWTGLDLLGLDPSWRALPMLVVVGAWAVLGARPERELPVAAVAAITVAVCLDQGSGTTQTWLAVDLTLTGVLAHLSALLNAHRRWMAWVGLGLMVAAQWVRLDQIGVETVEAYTLPLAVVLLAVGVVRIRHTGTGSPRALGPGLGLALVPTLLVALVDPISLRAVLLGLACLLVLGAGIALRWSAPLVAGAAVGLVLVLREATYASVLPQWGMIGTVGVVLTVIGVTWERRLSEVRTAVGYLRRLD